MGNKKGLFGNVVAWTMACEEQGRKTLHSHFLLWIENWSNLLDGLGNIDSREDFAQILKGYTEAIMSTRMHESLPVEFICRH